MLALRKQSCCEWCGNKSTQPARIMFPPKWTARALLRSVAALEVAANGPSDYHGVATKSMAVGLANLTHWSTFQQADLDLLARRIGRFVNEHAGQANCYVVLAPNVGCSTPLGNLRDQPRAAMMHLESQLTDAAKKVEVFPFSLSFDVRSAISAKSSLRHEGLLICSGQAGCGEAWRKRLESCRLAEMSDDLFYFCVVPTTPV